MKIYINNDLSDQDRSLYTKILKMVVIKSKPSKGSHNNNKRRRCAKRSLTSVPTTVSPEKQNTATFPDPNKIEEELLEGINILENDVT